MKYEEGKGDRKTALETDEADTRMTEWRSLQQAII